MDGDLSKLGLKDASVQQRLFMNRCPFLVIPRDLRFRGPVLEPLEWCFREDSVMIGGGCGPVGPGHTSGAPQIPQLRSG
jgi:hypothetical protein